MTRPPQRVLHRRQSDSDSRVWRRPLDICRGTCLLFLSLIFLCACSSSSDQTPAGLWSDDDVLASQALLQPTLLNEHPGVGTVRLAIALIEADGALLHGAAVRAQFYRLSDANAAPSRDYDLNPIALMEADEPLVTVYAGDVMLDRAGKWGIELTVTAGTNTYGNVRLIFTVTDETTEPDIGDLAPRSRQRTVKDVADLAEIDSSTPPDPRLHGFTVADALEMRRPMVIAFATPAFCRTRFCGPVLDLAVRPLVGQYQDRVSFVHIEPYDLGKARSGELVRSREMGEWQLASDTWVFVVDAEGRVAAKFEGVVSKDELRGALESVIRES